jgi:predicted AlkP superfamily pyrophosphatase or phosphodiesterase
VSRSSPPAAPHRGLPRLATRLVLSAAALALAPAAGSPAGGGTRVVLVTIDGFAADQLADESLEIPHLRALIAGGVRAESSQTVFPSVTHPSHTSIVTGVSPRVHGVIGNRMRNRLTGERFHVTNRPHAEAVHAPTLFDAAKARGLATAAFFWPESRDDPSLDRSIPEVFAADGVADPGAADPTYLEELRRARVPIDLFYEAYGRRGLVGAGDVALALAAAHEIRTRRPDLLAIHLVSTDAIEHWWGPDHPLSKAAFHVADACVGILRDAVEEAGLTDETVFVVGADHGFATVTHDVNLFPLFRDAGLLDRLEFHPMEWTLFVETTSAFDPGRDQRALDGVIERVRDQPHVARVVRPDEFQALGYPRYDQSPYVPGQYMVIGDVGTFPVVDPDDPEVRRRPLAEPHHTHGYLPESPRMYPMLVLAGAGIRPGVTIGHVSNLDIAPTVAHLMGLDMSGLEGRVLTEALVDGGGPGTPRPER